MDTHDRTCHNAIDHSAQKHICTFTHNTPEHIFPYSTQASLTHKYPMNRLNMTDFQTCCKCLLLAHRYEVEQDSPESATHKYPKSSLLKIMFTTLLALSTTTSEITHETDMHMYGKASLLKKILQDYLNCPLVPLSHHAQHMYTCHDQAHADKSLAFLLPPLGLYCLPRKLAQATRAGLMPSAVCALCCLCCLLAKSTVSDCFSVALY